MSQNTDGLPLAAPELEPELSVALEIRPIIDATPTSQTDAQPPASLPQPQLPEPTEVVLDVAYQVLDVLTTPTPP